MEKIGKILLNLMLEKSTIVDGEQENNIKNAKYGIRNPYSIGDI